jgi:ferric-dicitrate binding protein FerR (iron transport regulator)
MRNGNRTPSDPAFNAAWRLFCKLHDAPSPACAEQLVRWLGDDAGHVRALDDVLTLWALSGAALTRPAVEEDDDEAADGGRDGRPLQ